jgi:hypothetical protein
VEAEFCFSGKGKIFKKRQPRAPLPDIPAKDGRTGDITGRPLLPPIVINNK